MTHTRFAANGSINSHSRSDDSQFVKYLLSCTSVLTYRFLFWPFTCSMTKNVEKTLLCQTKYAKKKIEKKSETETNRARKKSTSARRGR